MIESSHLVGFSEPTTKRKFFSEQLSSVLENSCTKRKKVENSVFKLDNCELPARLEVVVLNGDWETSQTIPPIIPHSVNLQELDVVNELCIPWSECSGTEISIDDNCSFKENVAISDLDLHCSADSRSSNGNSTLPTVNSESDVRQPNENGDDNLSWLINFKVGSLFNSDEVDHDHTYQGKENEISSDGKLENTFNFIYS